MSWPGAFLGGVFGPLKGLIGGLSPFKKGLRGFFFEISSGKLTDNSSEKRLNTLENAKKRKTTRGKIPLDPFQKGYLIENVLLIPKEI